MANNQTPAQFMKQFLGSTLVMVMTAWLVAGCDVGPEAPAPKAARRPKPVKPKVVLVRTNAPKPVKAIVPGTAEYLDMKNGFRDAAFGQSESEFSNLVLKEKDEARQLATYVRTGDVLSLETVPLETIEYSFFKGRLYRIVLKWKVEHRESALATPPSTELAANCSSLYGRPKRHMTQKDITEYTWSGRKVEVILHEFRMPGAANLTKGGWGIPPTTSGQMVFASIPLRRELELFIASQSQSGL